ncbi:CGGC domain-containing protein [bacterium]|nr:CGGC domain-containing protein [bacterium]
MTRIGIIICDRYGGCAGGKCFRSVRERVGAFARYEGEEVEVVGFASCGGCPGGNIEHAPEEMRRNGAEVVHLATGFVVGYPPCPHLEYFQRYIPEHHGLEVVVGTHPVPEKYNRVHEALGTWPGMTEHVDLTDLMADHETRRAYD